MMMTVVMPMAITVIVVIVMLMGNDELVSQLLGQLVSWCVEPSQPQSIISGLNTNFILASTSKLYIPRVVIPQVSFAQTNDDDDVGDDNAGDTDNDDDGDSNDYYDVKVILMLNIDSQRTQFSLFQHGCTNRE